MVLISLKTFFRTGHLGPIRLGMMREEIRALLGDPDDRSETSRKYKRPTIWKYGSFELFFDRENGALWLIQAENLPNAGLVDGAQVRIKPWILDGHTDRKHVEHALRQEGIEFDEGPDPLNDNCKKIWCKSGVELLFDERGEHWSGSVLEAIRLSCEPTSTSA